MSNHKEHKDKRKTKFSDSQYSKQPKSARQDTASGRFDWDTNQLRQSSSDPHFNFGTTPASTAIPSTSQTRKEVAKALAAATRASGKLKQNYQKLFCNSLYYL